MKRKFIKLTDLIICWIYSRFCAIFFSMDSGKVLFLSESHHNLDGNLKAMYDYIPNNEYKKVYHFKGDRRDSGSLNEKLIIIRDIATSKYIFLDDFYGMISAVRIRKGQKLVQLWHGAGAYKKFGYSRVETGDNIKHVHKGYKKYTHVAVTSEAIRPCYAEAFGVDVSKVKATGIPRTDMFFDKEKIELARKKVYERYPEFVGKKVVLIAPTYRGRKVEDANYDFDKLNLRQLVNDIGDDYVVAVKWHPALYNNICNGKCDFILPDRVIDCSDYSDLNSLLFITSILITDYSSVIFDYFFTGNSIVYFTYDIDEYVNDRGFYFDFDEYIYGKVVKNLDELQTALVDNNIDNAKRHRFYKKFISSCNGASTEKIFDWVFKGEDRD